MAGCQVLRLKLRWAARGLVEPDPSAAPIREPTLKEPAAVVATPKPTPFEYVERTTVETFELTPTEAPTVKETPPPAPQIAGEGMGSRRAGSKSRLGTPGRWQRS